jgi:hypothetical protein
MTGEVCVVGRGGGPCVDRLHRLQVPHGWNGVRPVLDHHEAVGSRIRQRTQQHVIDDGEDGTDAADARAQEENHGEGEGGRARETARSLPSHASEGFHGASS